MGKTLLGSLMMGSRGKHHSASFDDIGARLEAKMGKIPFSGRYHREPRKLEDDYVMSESVLGSGYNGEVRMATSASQPTSTQKFAVKSLNLGGNQFSDREKREQLEAEVENYLSMDHPHITRLYDVYESKEQLHLVMECMDGGELFDRVIEKKRFSEAEASDALRQMLLALNYIHSHGIVHRDVKLENFIFDSKSSGHLKLIDFGFSKMWDPSGTEKLSGSLGTLAYVAPEVLETSYTSQCDMWSLGVIAFILLGGYMPFSGKDDVQIKNIASGTYKMRPDRWKSVSVQAQNFVKSLLEVNPSKRLTAQAALEHPFILDGKGPDQEASMQPCCEALRQFSHASKFRRCCMEMLAWSLSNEDRAKVREVFLSLNEGQKGAISFGELRHAMVDNLHLVDEQEVLKVFDALDYNHDQEIHYSDFLAAMTTTRLDVDDAMLGDTFRRFDTDHSGYITVQNLRDVLGNNVEGERVEGLIAEADQDNDGQISFAEFIAYMKGSSLDIDISETTSEESFDETSVQADEGVAHKMHSSVDKHRRRSSVLRALRGLKDQFKCFTRTKRSHETKNTYPVMAAAGA